MSRRRIHPAVEWPFIGAAACAAAGYSELIPGMVAAIASAGLAALGLIGGLLLILNKSFKPYSPPKQRLDAESVQSDPARAPSQQDSSGSIR